MEQPNTTALAHTLRELTSAFLRELPRHTLSRAAASTLSILERHGPQRITVLAEREVVSQPAMTGLIQRLEVAGYVARSTDPQDARASLVDISPAGLDALAVRRRMHDEAIAAWVDQLTADEVAALNAAAPTLQRLGTITETHEFV